jgi:hypothetical protein
MSVDRSPRGPEEHKALARRLGVSLKDLLVLDRSNDPFFKGTPAHHRNARWFADVWEQFGYTTGVHLRRVHYQLFTRGQDHLPSGELYQNLDRHWMFLSAAGTAARLLGYVDPEAFVDRRNEPVRRYLEPREVPADPNVVWTPPEWDLPIVDPAVLNTDLSWPGVTPEWAGTFYPGLSLEGFDYHPDDQPVLLELWIEKSTMNDVLDPLCRSLNINLLSGTGFASITAVVELLRRAERHGKPAHVLYVADFDPAGTVMPVAVARQAQFWREQLNITAELTIDHVVITPDQIAEYQLPRVPIKETDLRAAGFEARNGEGAVELDALEALHPGELEAVVRRAAAPYIDTDLARRIARERREVVEQIQATWDEASEPVREEMERLTGEVTRIVERYRPDLEQLAVNLTGELAPYRERLAQLREQTDEVARSTPFDPGVRPEPDEPDVDRDGGLVYDSRRGWVDQLEAFHARKAGQAGGA